MYADMSPPNEVSKWNVYPLKIKRDHRHADAHVVFDVWSRLEEHAKKRGFRLN